LVKDIYGNNGCLLLEAYKAPKYTYILW